MTSRIGKEGENYFIDTAGNRIVMKEDEQVVTSGAFLIVPDIYHQRGWRPIEDLMEENISKPYYEPGSMRVVPGGKGGRVTVIAKPIQQSENRRKEIE